MIPILLNLYIINKTIFFYGKNYCSCAAIRGVPQVQKLFSHDLEKKITIFFYTL